MLRKITLSSLSKTGEQERCLVTDPHSIPFLFIISASPRTRRALASCLRQEGIAVATYANGVRALRALVFPETRIPDVVLLDDDVTRSNGYGLIRALKTISRCEQTRVIVLSRFDGVVERLFSRLAGADDYLVKPLSTRTLLDKVAAHLNNEILKQLTAPESQAGACPHTWNAFSRLFHAAIASPATVHRGHVDAGEQIQPCHTFCA